MEDQKARPLNIRLTERDWSQFNAAAMANRVSLSAFVSNILSDIARDDREEESKSP